MRRSLRALALPAAVAAALAGPLAAAPSARAEPAMWTVKDADTTIYLFGTVHLLRPDRSWLTPRLQAALTSCRDLTLEITDSDAAAMTPIIMKYGFDQTRTLSSRLGDRDRRRLAAAIADLGGSPEKFETMRPWFAGLQLTLGTVIRAGYDPAAGVEKILRADAEAQGEEVHALETAEAQIAMLAGLPDDIQLAFLIESLDQAEKATELLDEMAEAWARGDETALDDLVNQDMRRVSERLYRTLLVERNERFADRVKTMLETPGVRCVAVGAGHLVGADSVQAQLRKLGVGSARF